jgi:hypothetical protein
METESRKIKNSDLRKIKKEKEKEKIIMPNKENYSMLLSVNYTIKQLREIASHHQIKINGASVKAELVSKIYTYFKHFDNAAMIQRAWRRYLRRQYNKLRGPARFNRRLCVNETDFFTMDDLIDIPYTQFYSFQDRDSTIYGFDVLSIYTLFQKGFDTKTTNPYNRNILAKSIKKNILKLIWLSKLFNEEITVAMTEETIDLPSVSARSISLFHDMDILGNYTNVDWFLDLNQQAVVRFIMELNDIWSYRANLSETIKREICPTHNDIFRLIYTVNILEESLPIVQDIALSIIEIFVRSGINQDSRCLGTNYVLCALTLVNPAAAVALPWLFQSVL